MTLCLCSVRLQPDPLKYVNHEERPCRRCRPDRSRHPVLRAQSDAARADSRRREGLPRQRQSDDVEARRGVESGRMGPAELHHRRLRRAGRARQPALHRRDCALRQGCDALRQAGPAGRPAPAADRPQDVARDGDALRSEGVRGAHDADGAARVGRTARASGAATRKTPTPVSTSTT